LRLLLIACKVLYREFCYYAAISRNLVELRFLEQGLHNEPTKLRERVQAEIDAADGDGKYDAILLGYGLCSNGIEGLRSSKHKIVIPRAHDCITFFLGSKERYINYFSDHPGTYWYTPGWIETNGAADRPRYDAVYREYVAKYGEDNARYLFEVLQAWIEHYDRAAYVDLGFCDNTGYRQRTRDIAAEREWEYVEVDGDPRLVIDLLEGNWESERFLVVEPGEAVQASHDECILRVLQ
jgi:hypothetical protein